MLYVLFPDILKPEHGSEDRADFEERRQLVLTCSKQIGLALANLRLRADLRAHATHDVLTGLPNRRWFFEAARDALAGAAPVALLSLDVDNFKTVNDTYGHSAGDTVLRVLASVMSEVADPRGTACRIGGEEFVVLLPGAETARAADLAETLRAAVEERGRAGAEGVPAVTISIGVAGAAGAEGVSVDALLERADAALYRAKREGRNRVAVA
jgi:diguanylate cyclase (GGDEF)-like protein